MGVSEEYIASIFRVEDKAGFLHGLLFDPENGGDALFRNTGQFIQTIRRYNQEYRTFHSHHCEKLKFKILQYLLHKF
jgi:hypothetical protein